MLALGFCTDMSGHGSDGFMLGSGRIAPYIYALGRSLKATGLKETWVMEYLLRGHNCGGQGSRGRPLRP